jgi:uncharacterized protein YjiS (DUF1127 family)
MKTTLLDTALMGAQKPASGTFLSGLFAGLRKGVANRALHRQLRDMDDSLLRDIGLGQDEIYRVRQGHRLTPRSWQ